MTDLSRAYIVGLDLGKRIYQVHVEDQEGIRLTRTKLARESVLPFFSNLPRVTVAMEACAGSNHWAQVLSAQGHTPKLLDTRTVAAVRTAQKNDANDAQVICTVARLPSIRGVVWKTPEQQAVLALHRIRKLLIDAKIAISNQTLALLAEFGNVSLSNMLALQKARLEVLDRLLADVPLVARATLVASIARIQRLRADQLEIEQEIQAWHQQDEGSRLVATIPGIGYLTASAFVATVGQGVQNFASGRDVSAWLGLVPTQHSTGGAPRLLGIGRHGNAHMRSLLFAAAMSSMMRAYRYKRGPSFLVGLLLRGKHNKVAMCALANKMARTAWRLLHDRKEFEEKPDWQVVEFARTSRTAARKIGEGSV